MKRIYLDTAAGTPLEKKVQQRMRPLLEKNFGNPSSIYSEGVLARHQVELARKQIAKTLSVRSAEIFFVGGGTEANNLAILGTAYAYEEKFKQPGHIITTKIEHHSVLAPIQSLIKKGWTVSYLPVNKVGLIEPKDLAKILTKQTALVSIGYVNNEIGVIAPLNKIARVIRQWRSSQSINNDQDKLYPYFHTDACQASRFLPLEPLSLGVDLMTVNAAKMYGPKGVGFLYKKKDLDLKSIVFGGGQESGLRSGTENVAGIVGLAEALLISDKKRQSENKYLLNLRNFLIAQILGSVSQVTLNGDREARIANNANFSFSGVDAELLVIELDAKGIACSTGSACSNREKNESHVLIALDDKNISVESIRFTLGRDITKRQIKYLIKVLLPLVEKLRQASVLQESFKS